MSTGCARGLGACGNGIGLTSSRVSVAPRLRLLGACGSCGAVAGDEEAGYEAEVEGARTFAKARVFVIVVTGGASGCFCGGGCGACAVFTAVCCCCCCFSNELPTNGAAAAKGLLFLLLPNVGGRKSCCLATPPAKAATPVGCAAPPAAAACANAPVAGGRMNAGMATAPAPGCVTALRSALRCVENVGGGGERASVPRAEVAALALCCNCAN